MTSSSSSIDSERSESVTLLEYGITFSDYIPLIVKRSGIAMMGDGSGRSKFTLHMEAKEPDPLQYHEIRRPDVNWPRRHMRMYLYFDDKHNGRFAAKHPDFNFHIPKKITGGKFSIVAEWLDTQTSKGSWSVTILADRKKRPGQSWMLFHFTDQEDAMMFKLFQEDIDLRPTP